MKFKTLITAVFVLSVFNFAQAQLAMGKWRTHLAFNSVVQIAQSENKIFAVSGGSLFSIDKEEKNIELYSKMTGLSDNNVAGIEYDAVNKLLLIIYSNGNVDMLGSGGVKNIPDFYNKQMGTSKSVNQIIFYENRAYLSCDFGILVLNMTKAEVADTYYIGANGADVKVLNSTIHGEYIYGLSSTTIYKGLLKEPNLANFEFWSAELNLPGEGDLKKLASFGDKLILLRGNQLYSQTNNQNWQALFPSIKVSGFFISNNKIIIQDTGSTVYFADNSLSVAAIQNPIAAVDVEFDVERNLLWMAGDAKGVIAVSATSTPNPEINYYRPNGPTTNVPWQIKFSGSKMFVVQGGRWASQNMLPGYVMMYENNTWTNLDPADIKLKTTYDALDFMNVAVDPLDNKHFFVTSYGTGLYEFTDNVFSKWHNISNSTIETVLVDAPNNYMRLDGAIFDKDGNLFLTNSGVSGSVKVLLKNGKWTKLVYPEAVKPTLGKIMISNENPNHKWIPSVRYSTGLFVFDDNGTIENSSDDRKVFKPAFVYPETDNGQTVLMSVSPGAIYDVVQDKNNVVWVGTDAGPFLFYNPSRIFDPGYTCSRVKIPRNDNTGQADYLLQNEKIKAIAIDGANRKWLGTETSGVYLMSENGQETIRHFTTENSPLLSDDILSIAIHPVTGEVFFGTGRGIVSYQSDALDAEAEFSNVHAYPNPVREGYSGTITITGLVKDTQVKITDLNGNLICETVSNGGIATWNGKDVNNRKVSTGIYLVICVNEDGTQSAITKIMVIN